MLPLLIDIILMARKYRIIYKLFELIIKSTMGLNTRSLFLIICILLLKKLCVYVLISVWVFCVSPGAHRVQKRAADSTEVELEAVANLLPWALGTELRFSARTAHTCS